MALTTPDWWYLRGKRVAPVTRTLLTPVAHLYAQATARRIRRARPLEVDAAVICVGNLTVGGSGKTPIAREALRLLRGAGVEAHALSRGHGGRLKGPLRVDPDRHDAFEVGDEPLLLARDGPAWVSRARPAGALAAVEAGARAVVMDDGHQNPTLRKRLSLVAVDGETRGGQWPFGDGAVFPAGPMREPLSAGLERADAVVVLIPADLPEPDPELLALFSGLPVLAARLEPAQPPPPGPQLGFAGVAKPWRVEAALKAAGCDLVDFAPFPDHAPYAEAALKTLQARASLFDAGLVTTEKDWVRLPPAWRARVRAWPVRARFLDEDEARDLLLGAVGGAVGGRRGTL